MPRNYGSINVATVAETHDILRSFAITKLVNQREAVKFPQCFEKVGEFLLVYAIHRNIFACLRNSVKLKTLYAQTYSEYL